MENTAVSARPYYDTALHCTVVVLAWFLFACARVFPMLNVCRGTVFRTAKRAVALKARIAESKKADQAKQKEFDAMRESTS